MKKIRVMQIITGLEPSGAERILYELVTRLDDSIFETTVVSLLSGPKPVGDWLSKKNIPVRYLGVNSKFAPIKFVSLNNLILKTKPDIIHTHLYHADQAGRFAAFFAGAPAVISTEHVVEKRNLPWRDVVNSFSLRISDKIVCVSDSVKQYLQKKHKVSKARLVTIPNGIDLNNYKKKLPQNEARKMIGLPEGLKIIASTGRLDTQKGYDVLIKAASILRKKFDNILFCIAGDGPERNSLTDKIAKENLEKSFRLLGQVDNVAAFLNTADVYVQPSRWEGLPLALIEAMASSLPVVTTDAPGNRDIIRNNENGIAVKTEDSSALAQKLLELLTDKGLAEKLARSAHNDAVEKYDADIMAESYAALYKKVYIK